MNMVKSQDLRKINWGHILRQKSNSMEVENMFSNKKSFFTSWNEPIKLVKICISTASKTRCFRILQADCNKHMQLFQYILKQKPESTETDAH